MPLNWRLVGGPRTGLDIMGYRNTSCTCLHCSVHTLMLAANSLLMCEFVLVKCTKHKRKQKFHERTIHTLLDSYWQSTSAVLTTNTLLFLSSNSCPRLKHRMPLLSKQSLVWRNSLLYHTIVPNNSTRGMNLIKLVIITLAKHPPI
jgi:hypothetical protein